MSESPTVSRPAKPINVNITRSNTDGKVLEILHTADRSEFLVQSDDGNIVRLPIHECTVKASKTGLRKTGA